MELHVNRIYTSELDIYLVRIHIYKGAALKTKLKQVVASILYPSSTCALCKLRSHDVLHVNNNYFNFMEISRSTNLKRNLIYGG